MLMGRWKKDIVLTPAQEEYRLKILKKKLTAKSDQITEKEFPKASTKDSFISDRIVYMVNCVYWVEEYAAGRADAVNLKSALLYLEEHCKDIRKKIEQEQSSKTI